MLCGVEAVSKARSGTTRQKETRLSRYSVPNQPGKAGKKLSQVDCDIEWGGELLRTKVGVIPAPALVLVLVQGCKCCCHPAWSPG